MKPMWLLLGVAAAALAQTESGISREGQYWVRTLAGATEAPAARQLRVSARGAVRVQGVQGKTLSYSLKKRVRARSREEAERLLGGITVSAAAHGEWAVVNVSQPNGGAGMASELDLKVPRTLAQAFLSTQAGAVEAYDLDGAVTAEAAASRVRIDRVRGSVEVRTGGGEIALGTVGGSVRCLTSGGSIRAASIGGEAFFQTGGGEIGVGEVHGPVHASTGGGNIRIERAGSRVTADTAGGLIDVIHAGGPVVAGSVVGAIRVASSRGVRCESVAGTIQLRSVTGALRVSTEAGSILAELAAGGLEESFFNTGSGDITVFIPSNLPVTIRAENESAGGLGRIVSEFPEIQVRLERLRREMPSVAEGAINGGGPVLRLAASGGTIYLRRQK